MSNITDRELLAFSNATNLEWQFLIDEDEKKGVKLHSLLIPESFFREDKSGNFIGYTYMPKVKDKNSVSEDDKIVGLDEMRKKAPVTMNYLEECDKGSKEGDFLKNWEVVYGADSYKIITEYIDNIKLKLTQINPDIDVEAFKYPTREEVERKEKCTQFLEFSYGIFSKIMTGVSWYGVNETKFLKEVNGELIPKSLKENIHTAIFKDTQNPMIRNICGETGCLPLSLASHMMTRDIGSLKDNLKIAKSFGGKGVDYYKSQNSIDIKELSNICEDAYITISEKFDYSNMDFKVVVFKKGNDIVIAYKNKLLSDTELLPKEIDYLNIVCSKIKIMYPKANITFTGYEGGADLSFLNALSTKENACLLYSSPLRSLKGLIDFTEKDLNKNYNGNTTFKFFLKKDGIIKKFSNQTQEIAIYGFLVTGLFNGFNKLLVKTNIYTFITWTILLALSELLSFINTKYRDWKAEKEYQQLLDLNYISKNHIYIKGYITNIFLDAEYIELKTEEGKNIKVERNFALYYMFELHNEKIRRKPKGNNSYKESSDIYFVHFDIEGEGFDTDTLIGKSFKLKKNSKEIYALEGLYIFEQILNGSRGTKEVKNEGLIKETPFDISKTKISIKVMELVSNIQRGYMENKDNLSIIYLDGNEVIKSEKLIFDKKTKNYLDNNKYTTLSEGVFLPFIGEDGNLQNEIREEYCKSIFKGIVKYNIEKIFEGEYNFYHDDIEEKIYNLFNSNRVELEKQFFYYDVIAQKLKNEEKYKNYYALKRTGRDKGIITLTVDETEMRYGYDTFAVISSSKIGYALLFRDEYSFEAIGLKSYDKNKLRGSADRMEKLYNNESVDSKGTDHEFASKDNNRIEDSSTGLEKLKVEGKEIGSNLIMLKKLEESEENQTEEEVQGEQQEDSAEQTENPEETEASQEIVEPWFEEGKGIEEYYEEFDLGNDEKLKLRYIYERKDHTLAIRFSKNDIFDTELKINDFKNGDFSIDLPRYHKLMGSAGENKRGSDKLTLNMDSKQVENIESTVGSAIIVNSTTLGQELKKIGKVKDEGKTIYKFAKGSNEVMYYYKEDQILEISYGSLKKDISRFSNNIKIKEFKNGDCNLYLPFGEDFVEFIEEEAEEAGKVIDNVSKISLLNYYDDKGKNTKKTFVHDISMNILSEKNLSIFNLATDMIPANIENKYNLSPSAKTEVRSIWANFKASVEKGIKDDLNNYRKAGYMPENSISEPEDSVIDKLMAAFGRPSQSHYFFKSFQEQTQEERAEEEERNKTEKQKQELEDSKGKNPKKKEAPQEEKKPSARYMGKNGRGGIWR